MNNTTVASDNSSDSASNHKKTSIKSEIEIIDQKIIKCFNEINHLEQRIQKEWSKQMNSHLRSFYQDDGSGGAGATGPAASTPQHDSSEYKKRIVLLNKKLRAYEKRRQKLQYEENQREKEQQPPTAATTQAETTSSLNSQPQQSDEAAGLNNSSKLIPLISVQPAAATTATSSSLQFSAIKPNQSSNNLPKRNGSFANNNGSTLARSMNGGGGEDEPSRVENEQSKVWFDLSNDAKLNSSIGASGSFDASAATVTGGTDGTTGATPVNDETGNTGQSHLVNNNKSYQSLEKNMFLIQLEQQMYYLKLQQEKILSDIEDMQKKLVDSQQMSSKEAQIAANQISENVHKINFSLYKGLEAKMDEIKTSIDRFNQSNSYSLTHCHRDVKDIKDDVNYMKNQIEILEKSQKVNSGNIETTPTNYYQLFYKLLDIILTLATIILLAFTNFIASIKFVFMLYPRTIVILIFFYFLFYYLVDFDKLDIYFHRILFGDLGDPDSPLYHHKHASSHPSFVISFLRNLYGYLASFRSTSTNSGSNIQSSSSSPLE